MAGGHGAHAAAAGLPPTPCDATKGPCVAKVSRSMVQFRPKDNWKGEYGFDWLRIGASGEKAGEVGYESIIDGGYKSGTPAGLTVVEAKAALKTEFAPLLFLSITGGTPKVVPIYIPYLNLFPKGTRGSPHPPFEAELQSRGRGGCKWIGIRQNPFRAR